jgi:hypothetical protein
MIDRHELSRDWMNEVKRIGNPDHANGIEWFLPSSLGRRAKEEELSHR